MKNFLYKRQKELHLLIILVSFLVTFGITHFYSTHFAYQVFVHGYHIHHFYFGTMCLVLGGIMAVLYREHRVIKFASVLIGVGMGLFADEIGLLLNCTSADRTCTYLFPDSMDFIGTIAIVLVSLIVLLVLVDVYRARKNQNEDDARKF